MCARSAWPPWETSHDHAWPHRLDRHGQVGEQGGAAVEPIGRAFPEAVSGGGVDRAALSRRLREDPPAFARLEAIVHPLTAQDRLAFLEAAKASGAKVVVLDVPLLFETGADRTVDAVVVVSAPAEVQRERVLARTGMTAEKLEQLLARQVPDAEKRARADFVIETSQGIEAARAQVQAVLSVVLSPDFKPRRLDAEAEPQH
jgi:dephospho-CoA kinase